MPFYNQFPYIKLSDLNIDWLLSTVKGQVEELNELRDSITIFQQEIQEYVDNANGELLEEVDEKLADIQNDLNTQYQGFVSVVNKQFAELETNFNNRFNEQEDKINNVLQETEEQIDELTDEVIQRTNAIEASVDTKIAQNNEYIFERIAEENIDIKVINYFTGELVTVQEMFDYLAQFHLTNPITYTALAGRGNTYTELADYGKTYTDLAINGAVWIVQK